jgi:hypothetical protein
VRERDGDRERVAERESSLGGFDGESVAERESSLGGFDGS